MSQNTLTQPGQSVESIRRLILHGLLFVLLIIVATGLSTLIGSALRGFTPAYEGSTELATALSFTLIGGPLTWLLWRAVRSKLMDAHGADSALWSIQTAAVYLLSLAVWTIFALRLLSGLITADPYSDWRSLLGSTVGWGLVFIWQYRILHTTKYSPTELPYLSWVLGSAYGLVLAGGSCVLAVHAALASLLLPDATLVGASQLPSLLAAVVWATGALLVWWWHWFLLRVNTMVDPSSNVLFVLVCISLPVLGTLLSCARLLNALIPLPWEAGAWLERASTAGAWALAGVLIGTVFWIYHQAKLSERGDWPAETARQIISGIGLALGASGLGMVVNALLAALSMPYSGDTAPAVLRSGIALLVVGALAWFYFFRPFSVANPSTRRIYLVLFFGVSAAVALISLLVIGYRIFEFLLVSTGSGSFIDTIRAPFGWLVATAAVAAYHFSLWRADREELAAQPPAAAAHPVPVRMLMVVAPAGSDRLLAGLQHLTDVQLHWVQSAGEPLDQQSLENAHQAISARMQQESGGLLVIVDATGGIHFTALADLALPGA